MLLEAAMAEIRHDSAGPTPPALVSPDLLSPPHAHHNAVKTLQNMAARGLHVDSAQSSPSSKESSPDVFSSYHTGSSSLSNSVCDDSVNTQDGLSLVQDDNVFVSRVLNRAPSNLGESSRFGSYRSTAAVAAGGVPFRWEAEPGRCKDPATIQEEDEEPVAPLTLPPVIRVSATATPVPPRISPSSSAAPSPRSLTGKVKSLLINHVKKPSTDHFSFSSILENQRSPGRKSPHNAKRGRKTPSLTASDYASLSSIPGINCSHGSINLQRSEEQCTYRASVNSSDLSSSPYYFSPLSNASTYVSQGTVSPRISLGQSVSRSTASRIADIGGSQASARASNSSISSNASQASAPAMSAPALLANCLLRLADISNETSPPSLTESGDSDEHRNGIDSLSFGYPEMEILDDRLLSGWDFAGRTEKKVPWETSMAAFINRGGPSMNRSFSTSRITLADGLYRKPVQQSKYYSAQLSNLAQPKANSVPRMQDSTQYNTRLDLLFPLKKPHARKILASKISGHSEVIFEDRHIYADALDASLDCSVMTDNEELNSIMQSIMKEGSGKEKPAHELVILANDDADDYAYSPIASAFVFSPGKASQNGPLRFFTPSASDGITTASINGGMKDQHRNQVNDHPKSILKKPHSQELIRVQSLKINGAGGSLLPTSAGLSQSRSLSHSTSQKISSAFLRFADSEEQLYHSKKQRHHQNGMRSPACMQPMCSFLGRALLCRPKLARHAGRLHA